MSAKFRPAPAELIFRYDCIESKKAIPELDNACGTKPESLYTKSKRRDDEMNSSSHAYVYRLCAEKDDWQKAMGGSQEWPFYDWQRYKREHHAKTCNSLIERNHYDGAYRLPFKTPITNLVEAIMMELVQYNCMYKGPFEIQLDQIHGFLHFTFNDVGEGFSELVCKMKAF